MLNSAKKEKYKTLALAQKNKPKFSAFPCGDVRLAVSHMRYWETQGTQKSAIQTRSCFVIMKHAHS